MKFLICLLISFSCFSSWAFTGTKNITDVEISRRVQEQIKSDMELSNYARSLKIFTLDGEVLMRGRVLDHEELDTVIRRINSVPGVITIINEVEVMY